jgi:hypothetical protein
MNRRSCRTDARRQAKIGSARCPLHLRAYIATRTDGVNRQAGMEPDRAFRSGAAAAA